MGSRRLARRSWEDSVEPHQFKGKIYESCKCKLPWRLRFHMKQFYRFFYWKGCYLTETQMRTHLIDHKQAIFLETVSSLPQHFCSLIIDHFCRWASRNYNGRWTLWSLSRRFGEPCMFEALEFNVVRIILHTHILSKPFLIFVYK